MLTKILAETINLKDVPKLLRGTDFLFFVDDMISGDQLSNEQLITLLDDAMDYERHQGKEFNDKYFMELEYREYLLSWPSNPVEFSEKLERLLKKGFDPVRVKKLLRDISNFDHYLVQSVRKCLGLLEKEINEGINFQKAIWGEEFLPKNYLLPVLAYLIKIPEDPLRYVNWLRAFYININQENVCQRILENKEKYLFEWGIEEGFIWLREGSKQRAYTIFSQIYSSLKNIYSVTDYFVQIDKVLSLYIVESDRLKVEQEIFRFLSVLICQDEDN